MKTSRREFLLAGIALAAAAGNASGQTAGMSLAGAYAFSFRSIDGGTIRLSEFVGKPVLIVNVASQCGFTPQYAELKTLQERFGDRLAVVGVPSNEFNQEPGGPEDILAVAQGKYGVSFPLAEKVSLRGANAHPFYRWAALERPLDAPSWNFHKYLVGRNGQIAAAFPSRVGPMDARVVDAIARELKGD
jgi:glutathione peroxidase